jgi:hypothetical protein
MGDALRSARDRAMSARLSAGDTCWFATVSNLMKRELGVRHPERSEIAAYGARCEILDVTERYQARVYAILLPDGCQLVAVERELSLLVKASAVESIDHPKIAEERTAEAVAA